MVELREKTLQKMKHRERAFKLTTLGQGTRNRCQGTMRRYSRHTLWERSDYILSIRSACSISTSFKLRRLWRVYGKPRREHTCTGKCNCTIVPGQEGSEGDCTGLQREECRLEFSRTNPPDLVIITGKFRGVSGSINMNTLYICYCRPE